MILMIKYNAKTILFASLIAAMILPFSSMGIADAAFDTKKQQKLDKLESRLQGTIDKSNQVHLDILILEYRLDKAKHQKDDEKIGELEDKIAKKQQKHQKLESKISKIKEAITLLNDGNDRYDKLSAKIDLVIEKFVKKTEKFSDNPDRLAKINEKLSSKLDELKLKFSPELNEEFELKLGDNYSKLTPDERQDMIDVIISEKFKAPIQEKFVSDMLAVEDGIITVLGFDILPAAFASCGVQPDVTGFKQLTLDIDGAVGFEGDNELESVQRNDLISCLREYTLTFADEDHPVSYIDAGYDVYRLYEYGRIQDVEKFYVSNGNIWFLDSGSKSQGFLSFAPIHYQVMSDFSNTLYVSNTWNHLMDTQNTNPSHTVKTWYK